MIGSYFHYFLCISDNVFHLFFTVLLDVFHFLFLFLDYVNSPPSKASGIAVALFQVIIYKI